jgi:hypothetical protein
VPDNDRDLAARAIALVTSLAGQLTTVMDRLDQVGTYGRRSRRIVIGLCASVVLDISLSVITIFLAIGLTHANSANVTIRQSQLSGCVSGNTSRAQQLGVWDHVLGLSTARETSAQKQATAAFKIYVAKVYAPRNCVKLYGR